MRVLVTTTGWGSLKKLLNRLRLILTNNLPLFLDQWLRMGGLNCDNSILRRIELSTNSAINCKLAFVSASTQWGGRIWRSCAMKNFTQNCFASVLTGGVLRRKALGCFDSKQSDGAESLNQVSIPWLVYNLEFTSLCLQACVYKLAFKACV